MLHRVTLTGADDSITPATLAALSARFPWVEWGILVSESHQGGSPRFPSQTWRSALLLVAEDFQRVNPFHLSIHVCGRWVRQICAGNWEPFLEGVGALALQAERIQLNFHNYQHLLGENFIPSARDVTERYGWQIIFQQDGLNDALVTRARNGGVDAVPLYDRSGGAGVLPDEWPAATGGTYTGYAGGLGPRNLQEQLPRIEHASRGQRYWIDMETLIRTQETQFDLGLCGSVLEQCEPWVLRGESIRLLREASQTISENSHARGGVPNVGESRLLRDIAEQINRLSGASGLLYPQTPEENPCHA